MAEKKPTRKSMSKPSSEKGKKLRGSHQSARQSRTGLPEARVLVRLKFGSEMQLGPGKVELLEQIAETGSISGAARKMDMSYRRAWLLVDELTQMFKRPVVMRATGGQNGGGAEVTDFGRALIGAFRRVEARTRAAINEELAPFEADLLV